MRRAFPRHVAITGAAGNLGAALAEALAGRGARVSLSDVDDAGLQTLAQRWHGTAEVYTRALDVTDAASMDGWLHACHAAAALDWVIVNAALGGPAPADLVCESPSRAAALIAVNLQAAVETCRTAATLMSGRGGGRIILVSSLAARLGHPGAPVYAATKAGLRAFGQSLVARLAGTGVGMTIAQPGFLSQGMGAPAGWRPFSLTAARAAERIIAAATAGRTEVAFPNSMALTLTLLGMLPSAWRTSVYRRWSGNTETVGPFRDRTGFAGRAFRGEPVRNSQDSGASSKDSSSRCDDA